MNDKKSIIWDKPAITGMQVNYMGPFMLHSTCVSGYNISGKFFALTQNDNKKKVLKR